MIQQTNQFKGKPIGYTVIFYLSKTATLKNTKHWFSKQIIAKCRSKVLQNAPLILIFQLSHCTPPIMPYRSERKGNVATEAIQSNLPLTLNYSKTCVKQPLSKRPKIGFRNQLLLNVGQKYSSATMTSKKIGIFIKES